MKTTKVKSLTFMTPIDDLNLILNRHKKEMQAEKEED